MGTDAGGSSQLQALAEAERRRDLFGLRVDGWSAWRVLRHPVYVAASGLPVAQPARSKFIRSLQALHATVRLLVLVIAGGRRDLIVKTSRSALRLQDGAKFRDVYFDGLIDRGYSCLKLEEINTPDFDHQAANAWRPADLDPVAFTFWGRVLGRLFPLRAAEVCDVVAATLERGVQLRLAARWLNMRLSTVYWQIRLYQVLLKRIRPKAVLVSDTGEYALRIACARSDVRFIELQHGVFDSRHPDAVPDWAAGSPVELVIPDFLACRGTFWIEQLAGTRQAMGPAVPAGNELIDLARKRRALRPRQAAISLVLTSQGLDSERLVDWIRDMIARAPADASWQLAVKLHPVYDTDTRAFDMLRSDKRIKIIAGSEQPNIFDLLAQADVHLSIASACHFDAAALGVPSVVVPLAGHEVVVGAVDGVQIFLARTPAAVWELAALPPVDAARTFRYSTPGFVENLAKLLSRFGAQGET